MAKQFIIEARLKFLAGIITESEYNTILKESETLDKILDKISIQGISSLSSDEKKYLDRYSKDDIDGEEDNIDTKKKATIVVDTDLEDSLAVNNLHMSDNSNTNVGIAFQTERGMHLLKQAIGDFDVKQISDFTPEVVQAYYEFDDKTDGDLYNESSKAVFTLLKALKKYFPRNIASPAVHTEYDIVGNKFGDEYIMDGPAAFVDNIALKLNTEQLADILREDGVNVIPHSKVLNAFVKN